MTDVQITNYNTKRIDIEKVTTNMLVQQTKTMSKIDNNINKTLIIQPSLTNPIVSALPALDHQHNQNLDRMKGNLLQSGSIQQQSVIHSYLLWIDTGNNW